MSRIIDDLDLYILRFERFGREFPKSQNMSPVSFIQLALQLTYYKYETNLFQWVNLNSIRLNKPVSIDQSKLDSFEPVQIGSIEIRFMHVGHFFLIRIHNKLVSTYESASVRRFRLGRVDNIRANTPAALEWVRAMIGETDATVFSKPV